MEVLLVEDDKRIASLIKRGLEEQSMTVSVAYDGREGKRLAQNNHYDIMIADIILPEIDGLELCKQIRTLKPLMPIIMLTALGTTDDKVEGFDAGADDYLVKPFEMRELIVRIQVLVKRLNNRPMLSSTVLKMADLEMNVETKSVKRNNIEINLTPKEFKLLEYMMHNPERVLSRAEIAEKVWDTHFDTGTNFIDVYINYLRNKIDRRFNKKLIHTKPGMGFIFREE